MTGFYKRPVSPDGMYALGARYLLDKDSYWYPVAESCLRLDESRTRQEVHQECTDRQDAADLE